MKLIIDIPKGEYDKICKTMLHTSSGNPNFYFESKIAHGTLLEQIRAEIDEEQEEDDYVEWVTYYNKAVNDALLAIDNLCYAKKMIAKLE